MASLALLLALLPPEAHAGYYAATYTGGTSTTTDQPPSPPNNDSATGASWGGGNGAVYGCPGGNASLSNTASCAGSITATLTWTHGSGQTDQNDPAPAVELVQETCDTSWSTTQTAAVAGYTASGKFGNPFWVGAAPSGGFSGDEKASKYSVQGGATFSLSETPTCSMTGSGGPPGTGLFTGLASVNYGVTAVSPITISLTGTTLVNGTREVLTGQPITVSLNPLPSGCSASNYQWDIQSANGGSLCGGYIAQQSVGMTTPPSSSLQSPSVTLYDGVQDTVTVNLTVTITFPDKTTAPAKATAMVMVVKPTLSKPAFNLVEANNFTQGSNNTSSQYGAVETYNNLQIIVPVGFTGGTGYVVQKVQSTTRVDMRHTGSNYYQQQEQFGSWMPIPAPCLDGDFPYPFASIWPATPNGSTPTKDQTGSGIDTPGVFCAPPLIAGDTGNPDWYASTGNDQFMVWIMFNPNPSSSSCIWVPLNSFTWGWSNQANLNATTNTWSAPNFQPDPGSNKSIPSGVWPTWNTWVQYSGTGYLAMRP